MTYKVHIKDILKVNISTILYAGAFFANLYKITFSKILDSYRMICLYL